MATWTVPENAFQGTAATFVSGAQSGTFTPTSEPSVALSRRPADYFSQELSGGRRDQGSTSTPTESSSASLNRQMGSPQRNPERVVGLLRWEGQILEISDDLLTVGLAPADHDGPELVADFDASLLGPDSNYATPGDIIYLTTRTVRNVNGYPYQTSSLKLRRPGVWSEQELREIRNIAKEQAEFFKGMY
jgi:hypothetical protein